MGWRTRHSARAAAWLAAFLTAAPAGAGGGADDEANDPGRGDDPGPKAPGADPVTLDPVEVRERRRPSGLGHLVGDEPRAAAGDGALERPEFATVIRVADGEGETRSLAEILASSIGVHVRELGGLGAFSSLSVRGGASGHTAVWIDGVPQSQIASATTDLGQLELDTFSEIDLYRGGVPARLGGAALGGALELTTGVGVPPDGDRLALSLGAGSFGARHLRARWRDGTEDGDLGYHLSAGYSGADGDFGYFDDNGTNLNQGDDGYASRTNNGYDRADAAARVRSQTGDLTLEAGGRWWGKDQGVPGSGSNQSESASLETLAQQLDARVRDGRLLGAEGVSGRASGYAVVERQRYRDLDDEIGLGRQDRRTVTVSGGARAGARAELGERHRASAAVFVRGAYFDEDSVLDGETTQRARGLRARAGASVSDAIRLGGGRAIVRPGFRLDLLRSQPLADEAASAVGPMQLSPRTDVAASPRIAARVRLADAVAVKGTAGWYFRPPTAVELFGDRGAVIGNPQLESETGPSADVGVVLAPAARAGGLDRAFVEAVAFAKNPRDAIVFASQAGLVAKAQNAGDAVLYGGEIRASARWLRAVTVTGNYTWLESRQRSEQPSFDGKRLPHRPVHEAHARVDVAHDIAGRLAGVWADADYVAGNFLDLANFNEVPARLLFGAGVKFEPIPDLVVGVEVKNLADHRVETIELSPPPRADLTEVPRAVTDFYGYPLPGRAGYVRVEWRP